jgi:hypothetical protein
VANWLLSGVPVMAGRVTRPRAGNWVAELQVDAASASGFSGGNAATLVTDGGALTFRGTVLRGSAYAQNVTLRLVGGANGLARPVTPRFYRGVQLGQPLWDALDDAGEVLSATAQAAATSLHLGFWTAVRQPASEALTSLAEAAGPDVVWRVLPDGTVFFGADGFPESALVEFDLTQYRPLEKMQEIASEAPLVHPGETFNGFRVSTVVHTLTPNASRVALWYE